MSLIKTIAHTLQRASIDTLPGAGRDFRVGVNFTTNTCRFIGIILNTQARLGVLLWV